MSLLKLACIGDLRNISKTQQALVNTFSLYQRTLEYNITLGPKEQKNQGLFLTFPKCLQYIQNVLDRMLFDNSKSEEFDVFPLRFWNLFERAKNDFKALEIQNIGADFEPIESYQLKAYQLERKENVFINQRNSIAMSDDEDLMMTMIMHTNTELLNKHYNKDEVQNCIKSDPQITPSKDDFSKQLPNLLNNDSATFIKENIKRFEQQVQREITQPSEDLRPGPGFMERLVKQCGLAEEMLEKLKEQQINDTNIEYLSFEDFKQMGLPIGPSRQLDALLKKSKVPPQVLSPVVQIQPQQFNHSISPQNNKPFISNNGGYNNQSNFQKQNIFQQNNRNNYINNNNRPGNQYNNSNGNNSNVQVSKWRGKYRGNHNFNQNNSHQQQQPLTAYQNKRTDAEEEEQIFKEIKASARPLAKKPESIGKSKATPPGILKKRDEKLLSKTAGTISPSKYSLQEKFIKEKVVEDNLNLTQQSQDDSTLTQNSMIE
ncbi:UNKNOWN [Stylonychia lemnae]|uniref:Uncharacterized protein n=1 Tax=Stylonychia lemnae TaxID=5949 RepID=A0A078AAM6_STYLE|nr:UNKNOWN [Stylonychia lemnae]|eukprot:CDW79269.1 UNKNOWN [Stylonychia lemnae]